MEPPTRRVVTPPEPVLVDLSIAFHNPDDRFRRDTVTLRVKAEGLDVTAKPEGVAGFLLAWAQTTSGGWWGLVAMELRTGNGKGALPVQQWCPARALRPAATGGAPGEVPANS